MFELGKNIMDLLQVTNLNVEFESSFIALDNVSFFLQKGEM